MKIYWIEDRGFIEIGEHELQGIAEVKSEKGMLDVHIHINVSEKMLDNKQEA